MEKTSGATPSVAISSKTGLRSFQLLMLALMIAEVTCSMESSMVYVALAPLYQKYGDPQRVNWIMTAFMLASCATAAAVGRLGDVFGRKRVLTAMLTIATLGSLLSAFAPSLVWVIVGRALQGATMAILPLAYGIVRQSVDETRTTRAVALMGSVYVLGTGVGMLLGGAIVDRWGWHGIFFLSATVSVLALILVILFVPQSKKSPVTEPFDLLGLVLLTYATTSILLWLSWFGLSLKSIQQVALPASGLVAAGVFVWQELRHPAPFVDLRLFSDRSILFPNFCIFVVALGPLMYPLITVPLLQQPGWTGTGFGLTATAVGVVNMANILTCSVAGVICGQQAARYGTRLVLLVIAFLQVLGWLAAAAGHSSLLVLIGLVTFVLAPTAFLMFAMMPRLIMEVVPEQRTSEATGLTQSIRSLGQAGSAQLIGYILASSTVTRASITGTFPSNNAYTLAFVALVVCSVLALLALLATPKRRRFNSNPVVAPAVA